MRRIIFAFVLLTAFILTAVEIAVQSGWLARFIDDRSGIDPF